MLDAERIGVLVADKYPVVRRGIVAAVRRRWDLELGGEAEAGPQALVLIRTLRPRVALVEEDLPGIDGPHLASMLAAERSPTRVLIFARRATGSDVRQAIAAGAAGYVTKCESIAGVCEAIRRVASGERYLSPEAQAALLDHLRRGAPASTPRLTTREIEILRLIASGETSAEAGQLLHLSKSTVKNHQRHLYDKLGVTTAAAAVYQAMRQGILS